MTCSGPTTTASFSDNAPNPLRIRLGGPTSDAAYDDEGVNLIEVTTVGPCAVGKSYTGPTALKKIRLKIKDDGILRSIYRSIKILIPSNIDEDFSSSLDSMTKKTPKIPK